MPLIAELLFAIHRVAQNDWVAAHAAREPLGGLRGPSGGPPARGALGSSSPLAPPRDGGGGYTPRQMTSQGGSSHAGGSQPCSGPSTPLVDLAGLARLVLPAAELARVGLAQPLPAAPIAKISGVGGMAARMAAMVAGGGSGSGATSRPESAEADPTGGGHAHGKGGSGSSTGPSSDSDDDDDDDVDDADAEVSGGVAAGLHVGADTPELRLFILCVSRLQAAGIGLTPRSRIGTPRAGAASATQASPRPGLHAPELLGTALGSTQLGSAQHDAANSSSPARQAGLGRPPSRGGAAVPSAIDVRPPSPRPTSPTCDLSVTPFERWATEDAPTPPGAPPAPRWVDTRPAADKKRKDKRKK